MVKKGTKGMYVIYGRPQGPSNCSCSTWEGYSELIAERMRGMKPTRRKKYPEIFHVFWFEWLDVKRPPVNIRIRFRRVLEEGVFRDMLKSLGVDNRRRITFVGVPDLTTIWNFFPLLWKNPPPWKAVFAALFYPESKVEIIPPPVEIVALHSVWFLRVSADLLN